MAKYFAQEARRRRKRAAQLLEMRGADGAWRSDRPGLGSFVDAETVSETVVIQDGAPQL